MSEFPLPVLVFVSRTAHDRRERELLRWAQELCAEAENFGGYLGSSIRQRREGRRSSIVIGVRFDGADALLAWERSSARARSLEMGAAVTDGQAEAIGLEELDAALSGAESAHRPPKWRVAVMVWLALLPVSLTAHEALSPLLADLPWPLATTISTLLTVVVVIWATLPLLHRIASTLTRGSSRRGGSQLPNPSSRLRSRSD